MSGTGVRADLVGVSWVDGELAEVHRRLSDVAYELRLLGGAREIELLSAEHALHRAAFLLGAASEIDLRARDGRGVPS